MRRKIRETLCRDDSGAEATIIEWRIEPLGGRGPACTAYSLEDGSQITPLGGRFEHFYTGKLYTPL